MSRIVLKREKCSVTIFAFDAWQGLTEHTSSFDALLQALEGETELNVGGEAMTLSASDIVLLPAGKPHSVKAILVSRWY